jgi:hypothetical protein
MDIYVIGIFMAPGYRVTNIKVAMLNFHKKSGEKG